MKVTGPLPGTTNRALAELRGCLRVLARTRSVDLCHDVDTPRQLPATIDPPELVEGSEGVRLAPIGVDAGQVREWDDGGNRLPSSLDDDALPRRSGIDDLAELLPNLERGHRSHSAIIALW